MDLAKAEALPCSIFIIHCPSERYELCTKGKRLMATSLTKVKN